MPSNSQALKALEQSATEQKKQLESTVAEIHKESLTLLSKDLVNLHNTRLNNLTNSIRKEIAESLEKSLQSKTWLIVSLTALIVLIISIPSTWFLKPKEVVVQTETQTQFKEIDNPKLIQENRSLHAQNEKLEREIQTNESKIKQLQAENKSLKEWSILESNQGTTKDNRKWMKTTEVQQIENGKYWALIEKK